MATKRENVLPDYRLLLLAGAFLLLVYLLLPILSPFLIAAILAYICNPLVGRLGNLKLGKMALGRTVSTLFVMLLLLGVMIIFVLVVVPLLHKELLLVIDRLPAYVTSLHDRLEPWLHAHFGITLDINVTQIQELLTQNWKTAGSFIGQMLLSVSSHGMALFSWIVSLLLVPLVLFYLLRDWNGLINYIARFIPRRWYKKTAVIAKEVDLVLAEFLRGQLSVMVLMSIFYATGLWLAGLELAIPIGLISGLLGFVPYLGITTGIVLALLSGALQFTSFSELIPVLVVFGAGQALEGFLLTPWLVGDRIGLHPVVVIFALLAGGQLFGFAGILLALPVNAAIAVGLKHAKQGYFASDIYLK